MAGTSNGTNPPLNASHSPFPLKLAGFDPDVFNAFRDSVIITDLDGTVAYWNEGATRLFGWTASEMVGRHYADRTSAEVRAAVAAEIRRRAAGEEWNGKYEDYRKDGTRVLVDARVRRIKDATGTHVGIVEIASDISDLKQAKEERDRLWNYAEDPLFISGVDGSLRQVNPAWTRSLGWSEQELIGHSFSEFIHQEDWDDTKRSIDKREQGDMSGNIVNRVRCKNGSYRFCAWHLIPMASAGLLYGIARDVTEERQLSEQFQQSQKMEAVGRLAGGVAHDFNNLLTVILGYSDLLLMDLSDKDPKWAGLCAIKEAGQRAARLTRQLLTFSRKTIFEPKVLNLNDLISASMKLLQRLIGEDINVLVLLNSTMRQVTVDPGQIEQVIMNLVVNARDAMPTGGVLTLETRDVTLGIDDLTQFPHLSPGPYVEFTVSDTGHGMTEDVKSKIFEPFFTTKEVGRGTGLGLAVVHGAIQQCGGGIDCESVVGGGSKFRILLPALMDAVVEVPAPVAVEVGGTQTVLLVEDEEAVRKIARIALEAKGYTVLETKNCADAMRFAKWYSSPIHLLVTDVVMPDLNGRDLAEVIKKLRPTIRVLYISGFTDDAVVRHGIEVAADAFLQKPFTPVSFTRKVREVLDAP